MHAETCRDQTRRSLPDGFWLQIDASALAREFGKGWAQLRRGVVLNGYRGAKCWAEEQRGSLVVAGTLSDVWADQSPKYVLYQTKTVGTRSVVVPGVVSTFQNDKKTVRLLTASQYALGERVFSGSRKSASYKEFSTFNYCAARSLAGYIAFQANRTSRSDAVDVFKQAWMRRGSSYLWSEEFNSHFDVATPMQELDREVPTWRRLELDFIGLIREWPLQMVAEAGELVLALQASPEGKPSRYWVFRVAGSAAGQKIVPAVNSSGMYLQVGPTVASFQAADTRDHGKTELALLDEYCKSE